MVAFSSATAASPGSHCSFESKPEGESLFLDSSPALYKAFPFVYVSDLSNNWLVNAYLNAVLMNKAERSLLKYFLKTIERYFFKPMNCY